MSLRSFWTRHHKRISKSQYVEHWLIHEWTVKYDDTKIFHSSPNGTPSCTIPYGEVIVRWSVPSNTVVCQSCRDDLARFTACMTDVETFQIGNTRTTKKPK